MMNKNVIVTGASRGIGAAIAKTLASSGYNVIINYNKSEKKALDLAARASSITVQGKGAAQSIPDISQL